jgi:pimeloyl-ACP methyl ester carboxylesterase
MGSFVAQRLTLDHPERVQRLVLIGSAPAATSAAALELRDEVERLTDPVPPAFVQEFQLSTTHAPLPEAFLDRVVAESLKLPARVWRAMCHGIMAFDSTAELQALDCPTLLVWGDRDAIFGRDDQDRLLAAIAGARLHVHPQTGHSPQWERPGDVVRELLAFIDATGGRR